MGNSDHTDFKLLTRMLKEARPFWGKIVLIFFVNLLGTPIALLSPLPLKIAVDNIISGQPLPDILANVLPNTLHEGTPLLVLVIGFVLAIALLSGLHALASSLLSTYVAEKMVLGFRGKIFRHVQRLSIAYHDMKGTTDSSYRIQYDASAVQRLSMETVVPLLTAIITVFAMFYVIAKIDLQLAIVALLISPPLMLLVRGYRQPLRMQWRKVKTLEHAAWEVMNEVLGALRVVKAFGQEQREYDRFVQHSSDGVRARIRVEVAKGTYTLLVGLLTAAGTGAVLFIGIGHVQEGTLTLGALLVVMSYLGQLISPLRSIGGRITGLQGALASAERTFAVLDETPEVVEKPGARPIARVRGAVAVEHLTFAYEPGQPVLTDISFDVAAGTRVGIAGKTGAGKTTLVNLITRFYDPESGRILVDGVDIRDYKLDDYRNQFAIVLQEPVLFSSSIAENIAYARPDASEKDVVAAAKLANAHDFISGFPDGYDTRVGHRGLRLSGGERQRIGLARAFLKDAPILILDEPTSSVDMTTESGIIDAMDRLMKGRTTFIIAHRLTTLEQCDKLLVIQAGSLVRETSDVSMVVREALEVGGLEAFIGEEH